MGVSLVYASMTESDPSYLLKGAGHMQDGFISESVLLCTGRIKLYHPYRELPVNYYLLEESYVDGSEQIPCYGIRITMQGSTLVNDSSAKNISPNREVVVDMIYTLRKHLVTPVSLHDIVSDWLS